MASTVDVHMNKLIEQLKEQGILCEGGRILGSADGCAKQYKCSTAIHFMSLLSFKHNLVIDRAIGNACILCARTAIGSIDCDACGLQA